MKWYVTKNSFGQEIAIGLNENKSISGLAEAIVEYQQWIAEGNTPEQWNPDTITEPIVEPTIEPETTQPESEN